MHAQSCPATAIFAGQNIRMKPLLPLLFLALLLSGTNTAQENPANQYRNFPVIITLQFHSLSMPFRDIGGAFRNIGLGIGTEVSFNGRHDWVQQFSTLWYRNKATGNGWVLYTQTAYRPNLGNAGWYGEVKAGVGYYFVKRPNPGWHQVDGQWKPAAKKGKGMLTIPVGIGAGYHRWSAQTYMAPFASYQFMPALGYNQSVPVIPQTFLQLGTAVHPIY